MKTPPPDPLDDGRSNDRLPDHIAVEVNKLVRSLIRASRVEKRADELDRFITAFREQGEATPGMPRVMDVAGTAVGIAFECQTAEEMAGALFPLVQALVGYGWESALRTVGPADEGE